MRLLRTTTQFLLGALLLLPVAPAKAAIIEQEFEYDGFVSLSQNSSGSAASGRLEHYFDTFDPALGTLTDVWIYAQAGSVIDLGQFECTLGPGRCTIELPLDLILDLPLIGGVWVEQGTVRNPDVYSGLLTSNIAKQNHSSVANFPPYPDWTLDEFYTTPLYYLGFYQFICRECASIDDPLLVNLRGSATLTYEYTPASLPSTLTLVLLALFAFLRANGRGRAGPCLQGALHRVEKTPGLDP